MKHRFSWGAVMASMIGLPCMAENAAPVSAYEMTDTLAVELNGVEITANRAGVKTPVAFTNISRKEIAKANDGRDIPNLLEMTPSIVATSDAGGGIGYGGIRVRGSDASRINITANGVPINDSESHNVYWVNMPDLASSLRDIQVQRGPGLPQTEQGLSARRSTCSPTLRLPSVQPRYRFRMAPSIQIKRQSKCHPAFSANTGAPTQDSAI